MLTQFCARVLVWAIPDMLYDSRIQRQIARYTRFFADDQPGKLLIQAWFPLDQLSCSRCCADIDLAEVDLENQSSRQEYLNLMADEAKTGAQRLEFIDDDLVPNTWLKFGLAHCHLWLTDAPTKFDKDSSWTEPVLDSLDHPTAIQLDSSKKWHKIVLESYRYLRDLSEGKYLIMTGSYGPLDLAQALRGPAIYTDFYDSPEPAKTLLLQCADVLRDFQEEIWNYAELRRQGEILWGMYVPSPSLAFSVDGACMMSRELFEEFERPAIMRQRRGLPAIVHTHMLGQHLLPSLADLGDVKVVDPGTDPNTPRCMDVLDHLVALCEKNKNAFYLSAVNNGVNISDIYDNIAKLKKGRFVMSCPCENLKEAAELVEFVRGHSLPLE